MLEFVAFVGAVLFWGVIGIAIHETIHYVTAALAGREVAFDVWGLNVWWIVPASGRDWRDRAIGLAPFVTGVLAVLLAFVLPLAPTVPQWIGLALWAFHGDLSDFRMAGEAQVRPQG